MIVGVPYEGQIARFELDAHRLVGQWTGPRAESTSPIRQQVRAALEHPTGFPPLAKAVVPGDRVVIPTDPAIPDLSEVLGGLCDALLESGVEAGDITVLATRSRAMPGLALPPGVAVETHDPGDRTRSAYLATTASGRRIYLDRLATDADVVVPVGALSFGARGTYRGPWSEVFPGLADLQTRKDPGRATTPRDPSAHADPDEALREAAEVSWLLGSQFHVGVVVGAAGVLGIIAGHQEDVRRHGVEVVEASWSVRIGAPADLVIAGIGVPWRPTTLRDLAAGLETAAKLSRVGGKVVVLSNLVGIEPGAALRRLAELDDPRQGLAALRGLKGESDYPAARRIARALARADVYLLSRLEPEFVEAIGMFPLDDPQDARRLAQLCESCVAISPAEWMRAEPVEPAGGDR